MKNRMIFRIDQVDAEPDREASEPRCAGRSSSPARRPSRSGSPDRRDRPDSPAPKIFSTRKAAGDATISADTPTTTSVVCIESCRSGRRPWRRSPAARPWHSVRLTNSVMSGPGVIARMTEAMANWTRVGGVGNEGHGCGPELLTPIVQSLPSAERVAASPLSSVQRSSGSGATACPAPAFLI